MRRTGAVPMSCLLLSLLTGGPADGSEVTALRIRNKTFEPERRQLSFELWNESDKTITAWRLSLARSDAHGHAQRSSLDQDFIDLDGGGARTETGPLEPGRNRPGRWHLDIEEGVPGMRALSIKVTAVVFDDSTWQGDEAAARAILQAREARIEEIGKVVSLLESDGRSIRTREDWETTLRQQAKLLRQQSRDPKSSSDRSREVAAQVSAIRLELAQWLEDAVHEISLAPDPSETVGHLELVLKSRYEHGMRAVRAWEGLERSLPRATGGEQ